MGKIFSIKYLLLIFCAIVVQQSFAQDANAFVKKYFVIIQSTKDYAAAKLTAEKAAKQLNEKLDLRGLQPHKKIGLTNSKKDCELDGYPCYYSRGRYDDGNYVSIEWSNAFEKFAKGYYIVIVCSGDKTIVTANLQKTKKVFKDAYFKQDSIYLGCMH